MTLKQRASIFLTAEFAEVAQTNFGIAIVTIHGSKHESHCETLRETARPTMKIDVALPSAGRAVAVPSLLRELRELRGEKQSGCRTH